MAIYLRLITQDALEMPSLERETVEQAVHRSGYELAQPLEPHPRGGFVAYVRCNPEDAEELTKALHALGVLSVV